MIVHRLAITSIRVGERKRGLAPNKVTALAESIAAIGLLQPITVHPVDDFNELVAGLHRLEAVRSLGHTEIDAFMIDADAIDREIAEIDENLCRAGLTEAQEAQHLARRKELWGAKKVEDAAESGTTCPTLPKTGRGNQQFAADTAKVTGENKRTVNRKISRATKIAPDVLDEITGHTTWDKGVHLDVLKKLKIEDQRSVWQRLRDGLSPDIASAVEFVTGAAVPVAKKRTAKTAKEPKVTSEPPQSQIDNAADVAQGGEPPETIVGQTSLNGGSSSQFTANSPLARYIFQFDRLVRDAVQEIPVEELHIFFDRLEAGIRQRKRSALEGIDDGHSAERQSA